MLVAILDTGLKSVIFDRGSGVSVGGEGYMRRTISLVFVFLVSFVLSPAQEGSAPPEPAESTEASKADDLTGSIASVIFQQKTAKTPKDAKRSKATQGSKERRIVSTPKARGNWAFEVAYKVSSPRLVIKKPVIYVYMMGERSDKVRMLFKQHLSESGGGHFIMAPRPARLSLTENEVGTEGQKSVKIPVTEFENVFGCPLILWRVELWCEGRMLDSRDMLKPEKREALGIPEDWYTYGAGDFYPRKKEAPAPEAE